MLDTLEKTLDNAMAKARARGNRSPKKSLRFPSTNNLIGAVDYNDAYRTEEQYGHYRERFWTSARPIVARIASQPLVVARRMQRLAKSMSVSSMVRKGLMSPPPGWVGNADYLEAVPNHPFMEIWQNPNSEMTCYNMMESFVASLLVTGRGFLVAMPLKGDSERAFDLYAIPKTWMTPVHDGSKLAWKIRPPRSSAEPVEVSDMQVCGFHFADPSNPSGCISPLGMLGKSVLTDESISTVQYQEFSQGGMPKVALVAGAGVSDSSFMDGQSSGNSYGPVVLEAEHRRNIVNWFQQQYAGSIRSGLPIVLDEIIRDIKVLSRTPAEMAFLESSGLTKENIAEGLGTSKVLNGNFDNVTRASGALAEQFFTVNTLNPIMTLISQSLTQKMGPMAAKANERLCLWLEPAAANDPENTLDWARLLVRGYAIQRNELRSICPFNLEQKEGMDDIMVQQTMEERLPEDDFPGAGRRTE